MTDRAFLEESNIRNLIKWWLTAIIIILPFQSKIEVFIKSFNNDLSNLIGGLDEVTIVMLLPIALIKLYINKEYPTRLYTFILIPLLLLLISGIISGFMNGNSFTVTIQGIFDYEEYFLVIFIFAAFFRTYDEVNDIFQTLIKIALFLVGIALVQEVWALVSRYVLDMENYDLSNWRLGIYRPSSLMKSSNIFGLYILLMFIVYVSLAKKINYFIFFVFLSAIILSVSRVVYSGLIFLCLAQIYRRKKIFIYIFIPVLTLLLIIGFFRSIELDKRIYSNVQTNQLDTSYSDDREKVRQIAVSIWKDNIVFGAGPGMFGGEVSLKYNSHLYREYSFSNKLMWHLRNTGNVDQFWFQLLAEMGIFGVLIFCFLFVDLIFIILILRIWSSSYIVGNLLIGLLIITMTIIMFTTYTGLKNTSLMFTYCAIIGMTIGSEKEMYG